MIDVGEEPRKARGRALVGRDGPGLTVAGLGVGSSIHWHVLILAMLRRVLVQWGVAPEAIEGELGGDGKRSHVAMVREAASRVGVSVRSILELEVEDLRRIADFLASRVSPTTEDAPSYPTGWRADLDTIGRLSSAALAREDLDAPEALDEREPGADEGE